VSKFGIESIEAPSLFVLNILDFSLYGKKSGLKRVILLSLLE
jgi:hypothetical protein